MNKYIFLLAIFFTALFTSCGSDDEPDVPTTTEKYSCVDTTPIDGDLNSVYLEEFTASQFAEILPCQISTSSNNVTACVGGSETKTYKLALNKWSSAALSIKSDTNKNYAVYHTDYTSYTFTEGSYGSDTSGGSVLYLVKSDGIYYANPYTGVEIRQLLQLDSFTRTYSSRADEPLETYSKTESTSYSKPFTLNKLADDHFYIENADYTFECFNSAKGLLLTQIKPEEKGIGYLYKE